MFHSPLGCTWASKVLISKSSCVHRDHQKWLWTCGWTTKSHHPTTTHATTMQCHNILSGVSFLSNQMTEVLIVIMSPLQVEKATFTITLSGAGYTASADRHVPYSWVFIFDSGICVATQWSCGGANHGRQWTIELVVLAYTLAKLVRNGRTLLSTPTW